MIIKLDSGKELTLEEVKEVIDKFQGLLGEKEAIFIPYQREEDERFLVKPYEIIYTDHAPTWDLYTQPYCTGEVV